MGHPGQIVLFNFPQTDLGQGKLRPALVIADFPNSFNDQLICMISSRSDRFVPDLDEIIRQGDGDFALSGLKVESVIRAGRLAVVEGQMLLGVIGEIDGPRLLRVKSNISNWLTQKNKAPGAPTESDPSLIGLIGETTEPVTPENTAARWGSGLVAGYSTPALVALMENAAFAATEKILPEGQTTVGIQVNIKHLAATPVGMTVRARAELVEVDGHKLSFNVEAWDDVEKIGEGTHTRFVVDMEKFTLRLQSKLDSLDK